MERDEVRDRGDVEITSTSKVADRIKFLNVVTLLEKISNCRDGKEKIKKLTQYLEHLRSAYKNLYGTLIATDAHANNDSLFCILRLLLSSEDKHRSAFGMKTPTLAKVFAKILSIDDKTEDGRKLLNFKDPLKSGLKAGLGNFPDLIFEILEKRMSSKADVANNKNTDSPSIAELHSMLDKIVKSHDNPNVINIDAQCKILRSFILRLSPLEGKWVAKILLKSLGLGISKQQIFHCFHPQAQEYFNHTGNLEAVCLKLNDPHVKLDETDAGIQLFHSFKPMLCDRIQIKTNAGQQGRGQGHSQSQYASQSLLLPSPPFIIEIKFDGERFTIHYDSSKPTNDQFRYYSRAGNDWAHVFNLSLTPRLKSQIQKNCTSFILDGEMMAWDYRTKSFTQKGSNVNLVTMKPDDPQHCPIFIVFDLLYFNGEDLTSSILKERMSKLKEELVFVEREGVIQLNKQMLAHSEEQVLNALDEAVNNLEEGLIVKELNSKYQVGKRVSSWIKVKPEYFDDHNVTDLDLVLVGGYFTKSFIRGGIVNHFLAALVDKSQGPGEEEFFPLSRLGPGCLKATEVHQLVKELQPHFIRKENPGFKVHLKGVKRPDFYIDPKNSVVLQVKAAEILSNDSVALKYNLRFPRIVAVRHDKSWEEAMTVQDFHKVRTSYGGKLYCSRNRELPHTMPNKSQSQGKSKPSNSPFQGGSSSESDRESQTEGGTTVKTFHERSTSASARTIQQRQSPKKYKWDSELQNPLRSQPSTEDQDKFIKDIFNSRVFLVIGSLDWKLSVEKLLRQYGGTVVQNLTKAASSTIFAIIAENLSMKTVTFAKQGKWDILKLSWIQKCIEGRSQKIVQIVPEDLWSASVATRKQIQSSQNDYDEYGDSYTKKLTSIETKKLLCDIAEKMDLEAESETDSETATATDSEVELVHKYRNKRKEKLSLADINDEDMDEEDLKKLRKYSFLRGCKIAFRILPSDKSDSTKSTNIFGLSTQIKFYGGQVAKDETEVGVTHVLVFDVTTPAKKKHLSAHVVKDKWLLDSLQKKELLDELYYMLE